MDFGIADTINRHVAQLICKHLDAMDAELHFHRISPWYRNAMSDVMMGAHGDTSDGDRAWLVGMLAARTPDVDFDGHPADCDWDNLFSHFRAEILARRDPQSHPVREAQIPARDGVGSR
jgi:hypothetical protein